MPVYSVDVIIADIIEEQVAGVSAASPQEACDIVAAGRTPGAGEASYVAIAET